MCGPDPGPGCTGRTCGACPSGFTCNGSGTGCVVNPASNWIVTAVNGAVAARNGTSAWDPDGSAPDPRICLTINGSLLCTNTAADTYTPTWATGRFPATTASALMAGIQSSYVDVDLTLNDEICAAGPITFTADIFAAGSANFGCGSRGSFNLTLTPAP